MVLLMKHTGVGNMCALPYTWYMHDNLLKRHSFCWALNTKWYPSLKIDKENPCLHYLGNRLKRGQGQNKNRRYTSTSRGHCHTCIIICWSHSFCWALQSGTPQWRSIKKIHVKHDLGNRLNGGQSKNKIGGAHLQHVGIAINSWQFVNKIIAFGGRCTGHTGRYLKIGGTNY